MLRILRACFLPLSLSLGGCATLFNHGDELTIASRPAGASVAIDDLEPSCTTPCEMELKPDRYVVHIRLKGYKPEEVQVVKRMSGWFWANFAVAFYAVIGMGIDWLTDSIFRLSPEDINVTLKRLDDEKPVEEEERAAAEDAEEMADAETAATGAGPTKALIGDAPPTPPPVEEPPPLPHTAQMRAVQNATPEPYLDRQIELYYGGVGPKRKAVLRNRLYLILLEQEKGGGARDLEEAIRVERERFGP